MCKHFTACLFLVCQDFLKMSHASVLARGFVMFGVYMPQYFVLLFTSLRFALFQKDAWFWHLVFAPIWFILIELLLVTLAMLVLFTLDKSLRKMIPLSIASLVCYPMLVGGCVMIYYNVLHPNSIPWVLALLPIEIVIFVSLVCLIVYAIFLADSDFLPRNDAIGNVVFYFCIMIFVILFGCHMDDPKRVPLFASFVSLFTMEALFVAADVFYFGYRMYNKQCTRAVIVIIEVSSYLTLAGSHVIFILGIIDGGLAIMFIPLTLTVMKRILLEIVQQSILYSPAVEEEHDIEEGKRFIKMQTKK